MTAPSVSVLIAVHNGEAHLATQLAALGRQTTRPDEVILVDDRSTDRSREVIGRFRAVLPEMRLIANEPTESGKACCLNRAAATADGEVLVFLDQDDEASPGYVEEIARPAARYGFVFGRMEYEALNDSDHVAALWDRPNQDRAAVRWQSPGLPEISIRLGSGCCLAVRRDVYERIGGFATDVAGADDLDFCIRAALHGFSYRQVPGAMLSYRFRHGAVHLFRQRIGYGRSWRLLETKYAAAGLLPRSGRGQPLRGLRDVLSLNRVTRLQGAAYLGFGIGYAGAAHRTAGPEHSSDEKRT
jgi:GT2 family glycosyltransferase